MIILVVEDDPMVRRLLVRHFQKQHTVIEAPDAEAALSTFWARPHDIDVVVTDVHLPGMTGVELATRLRASRPGQAIVFVTGDVDEALFRKALAGGDAGYLLKPFEFFELDAAIAQAVKASPEPALPVHESAHVTGVPNEEWYAEQRRQILEAANQPVMLRATYAERRRFRDASLFLKIAIVVLALVGLAWWAGYEMFSEPQHETPGVVQPREPARERTVYVPYEAPATEPRRERRRER